MPREVRRVVAALNQLLARLSESIGSSQRFIANASHQLRTPLAALQAQTELALREVEDTRARQSLDRLLGTTRQTSRLASQLLTLARTKPESGGQRGMDRIDLGDLAADLCREWVPRALAKDIDLGFEGPPNGAAVLGNRTMLREMLANVVDNAIRYCPAEARVTVRVQAAANPGKVVLEVEDDGPGIAADRREEVFERFVRLSEEDEDGCGLGLAIVREIAETHGGAATIEPTPAGTGVRLRIALPAAGADGD